jgi:hypothetical protein
MTGAASRFYTLGGLRVQLDGSSRVCEAMDARFGDFATAAGAPAIALRVEQRAPFAPELEIAAAGTVMLDGDDRIALRTPSGDGSFDLRRRVGSVSASGLGAVDALLRAALALTLPHEGALLLHGAAVVEPAGGAWGYLGASGAGKSTVARAIGAACDELVVARLTTTGMRLYATPYWRGQPVDGDVRALVCLRHGTPAVQRLDGAVAVRTLLQHTIRYVRHEATERAVFALCAAICARTPLIDAACPTGPSFLPFLFGELTRFGAPAEARA